MPFQKKQYKGLTNVMKNGMPAEVIDDSKGAKDLTIRFSDGTIREHVRYSNFAAGNVSAHPVKRKQPDDYIGMEKRMNNGHLCRIVAVNDYNHIEVAFDNGVRTASSVYQFHAGKIGFPNSYKRTSHVGEKILQKNGLVATLTEYIDKDNVTLLFENGIIRKHAAYSSFKNGTAGIRENHFRGEDRVGQSFRQKNGLLFTITEYHSATNIAGRFETGEVREHIPFYDIQAGDVQRVSRFSWQEEYLGHSFPIKCGLHATVTGIVDSNKMTIRFDETSEEISVSKKQLDGGNCLPLGLSTRTRKTHDFCGYHVFGTPVKVDDLTFYHATDLSTGKEALLTPQMMVECSKNRQSAEEAEEINDEPELEL